MVLDLLHVELDGLPTGCLEEPCLARFLPNEDGKVARTGLVAMLSDVITRLNAGHDGGGGRLEK